MEDKRALDIIYLYDKEYSNTTVFRTLWQGTADLISPRNAQITAIRTPGEDNTREIYNSTAFFDKQDMVSGLTWLVIPYGQQFFGLVPKNKQFLEIDTVRRYLAMATERTHNELFESNFILQLGEALDSLITFGTCNLYSEWESSKGGLNFKAWDISSYQFLENNHGTVDTVLLKFSYTARQAVQEFGEKNVGEKINKAASETKTQNDIFEFIQCVRPRKNRNARFSDNMNMPFESLFINVKEKTIVDEGGFEEMPFAVARWLKSTSEKWGRGQGTECISDCKTLQQEEKDLNEFGNKVVNPAREILESFEGTLKVKPGGQNFVLQIPSTKILEPGTQGAFPITKEILEHREERIHRAFFKNVFSPLKELTGDRRTELEIDERIKESLPLFGIPAIRMQSELFTPNITRDVMLLIRNGRIPYPPLELQGQGFEIEYIGKLALALRNQQAKGFQQWSAFVAQMDMVFPGINRPSDNIDSDSAVIRMGTSFGVNIEDIATEEEVAAKREARAKDLQEQKLAQLAASASDVYGKTTKKAEEGSAAEKVMAGMGV